MAITYQHEVLISQLHVEVLRDRESKPASSKGNNYVPLIRGSPQTFEETHLPQYARYSTIIHPIPRDHVNPEWLASEAGRRFDSDALLHA